MLNINKNLNGGTLTVSLEGRLDTTTAPQLEESLRESMTGISELILDFKDLEYISSAGLRVLLSAQKNMAKQGSMKLIHVRPVRLCRMLTSRRLVLSLAGFFRVGASSSAYTLTSALSSSVTAG